MPTLQDFKKQQGLTNKQVGLALGCSAGVAGMILQGRHLHVYHDEEIQRLADILGITFERCWFAMCESLNNFMGTPGVEYQRADEIRQEVQEEMQVHMPELGIEIERARELAVIDGSLVVPQERWIEA